MDKAGPRQVTEAAGRRVTRNAETRTPLVSDREAVGRARETRLATVASDPSPLPAQIAGAARTARRRGRPAAAPGKDHHHQAEVGATAHRGPPVAVTVAAPRDPLVAAMAVLPVAAMAVGRRNARLAGGWGAVPGFRRLAAR
jgi:hypothetical protein